MLFFFNKRVRPGGAQRLTHFRRAETSPEAEPGLILSRQAETFLENEKISLTPASSSFGTRDSGEAPVPAVPASSPLRADEQDANLPGRLHPSDGPPPPASGSRRVSSENALNEANLERH